MSKGIETEGGDSGQSDSDASREAMFQAQKMEALGVLSSGIAHDFNNLLTVILGNLDLLRRAPEARRARLIDNATQAVEQGRKLTQQLLSFGRRNVINPETVDANRLLLGMEDMIKQSLRGDILLRFDFSDAPLPIEIDPSQFQIAVINLAVNARDAMPKGGEFVVTTRVVDNLGEGLPGVSVSVSDNGCGMPPEVVARAFEPFFSTKEFGRGTGLGLPQVYGFTKQSGGTVRLDSVVGIGTILTIELPRGRMPIDVPDEDLALAASPPRSLRILLAEDNAQVAEVATAMLMERGHTVVVTENAIEALAALEGGEPFDLILSDLVMPGGMDGFDLARTVRARWPALPVLLATGYSDQAAKAIEAGFPLIAKPYDPATLLNAVERAGAAPAIIIVAA